jgi:DNA-binding transcriptional regulator/RsmH inhibitor MraZ
MVTGQINRLEIWDADKWARVNSEGEASMNDPHGDLDDMTI